MRFHQADVDLLNVGPIIERSTAFGMPGVPENQLAIRQICVPVNVQDVGVGLLSEHDGVNVPGRKPLFQRAHRHRRH